MKLWQHSHVCDGGRRLWAEARQSISFSPRAKTACFDFTRNQRTFRTAWRSLVREAGTQAGRDAARAVLQTGGRIGAAKAAVEARGASIPGFPLP